ncbi:PEGA domain-containing protein [Thermococcus sp.]
MRNIIMFIIVFLILLQAIPTNAMQQNKISLEVTILSSYAGFPENPNEIRIKVTIEGTSQVFSIRDFEILVGGKPAKVVSLIHEELDFDKHMYIISIIPPKEKSPGKYDLQVILPVKTTTLKNSITYSGENVDIVVLIDGSGSMKQNDPQGIRKEGAKLLISKLDSGDAVAVIEFDSNAHVLFPLHVIRNELYREKAIKAVESIGAQGKTNIQEALNIAYEYLLNSSTGNNRKAVILLTDGYNTVGSFNETGIIKKFRNMGWSIYTIALTGEADEELLRKLAEETGGIYMKANNAKDVIPVYNNIKTFIKNEVPLTSESGEIKSGEEKEGEILIGNGIKSFEITVVGKGIDLYLYLPNGSMVELNKNSPTGTDHKNIYYIKSEDYQFYRVVNPQPGFWKYRIVTITGGEYHLSASANAPLRLIPNVRVFQDNGTVIISGRVLRNGTVVKTASVNIVLKGAFGEKTLSTNFVREYSIGGVYFINAYIAIVKLNPGNYSVRLTAKLQDGMVLNSKVVSFRVGGLQEIYRGEGYIVATDGVSRTYLLNFKKETLWSYETGCPLVAHIHNGLVAIGNTRIYMFNITGEPLWDYQFNASVTAVTIGNEHVAVAVGMRVYLFTLNGRLLWEKQLPTKNGKVKKVLVEDKTEIRIYVVQEKETTVLNEDGEMVGTIEISDVKSVVQLVSEAVKEVIDMVLDTVNTIHVLSGFHEVFTISISPKENITLILPGEIEIDGEYRDYIAVGTSNSVRIYDLRGNKICEVPTENAVIKLVFYDKYLIAGTANGEIYVLLVKDGTIVKEYQTGSRLVDMSVVELKDGAYIIAKCLGGIHMFKLKVEEIPSEGNVTYWVKTYGGSEDDRAYAVAIAPNGDIMVAGETESFGAGSYDLWVFRLDENGNVKWQKTYGGSAYDWANAVAVTPNGDIIVAGYTKSFGAGSADAWILRLDSNGNVKWQKTYGEKGDDGAWAIAITSNGDILVAGLTDSFGDSRDVWVLKLDEDGNVKWQKTYGEKGDDFANAVTLAPNGDIIVTGGTRSFGAGNWDAWVLRLPPDGKSPNCEFCSDSNAQIKNTNAHVESTHAEIYETDAKVHETNAKVHETNAEVKTLWAYGAVASGILKLFSEPSEAEVYVNGTYRGATPLTLNLTPGTYEVKLSKSGYHDYTTIVKVKPGKETEIIVTLTHSNVDLFHGLIAYYSFDDIRGNVLPDDSGNGHEGIIHGNPKTVDGIVGKAIEFDGVNDWIYVGNSEDLRLSSFTLSFWVKINPDDEKFMNNWVIWLGKGGLGDDCYGDNANYLVYSRNGYFYAGFESEAHSCYGVNNDEFIKVPLERFKGWVFVTLTYDSNSRELNLYLNGSRVGSIKTRNGPELNSQPLTIGMNGLSGFYENKKFKGILDEVRIYNRALSEEEILQLMKTRLEISEIGILVLYSEPSGAEVYINGHYRGETPLRLKLPPGTYSLKVTKEMYKDHITNITLSAGERKRISIQLSSILNSLPILKVSSSPLGAKVYINGSYRGKTPLILQLYPGTYKIKLAKDEYTVYTTTITLKIGENRSISVNLTPAFGYLSVTSNPSGAKVYVDGGYIGETPIEDYKLYTGNHKIRLIKDGYEDYTKTIAIHPGQTTVISASLTPANVSGTLTFTPSSNKRICGPAVFVVFALLALLGRRER